MNFKKHNQKGFTLIELLVVIAIIAILSYVVLGYVGEFNKKGRDTKRKENIDQIAKAINLHFSDKGYLPGNATGWCTYISNATGGYGTAFQTELNPYMAQIPLDPVFHNQVGDYLFSNTDNSKGRYVLCANLEEDTGEIYDHTGCLNGAVYNYCITQ